MTVQELEKLITDAAQAYYEGNPIMSDARFDQYVLYLRSISPHSEVLNKTGWGYKPNESVSNGEKVAHAHGGMGSIKDKPRTMSEIPDRLRSNVRISAKLDGLSGVLHFVNGQCVKCLTRGDGSVGIDKTDKFYVLLDRYGHNVPPTFTGEIRGEFVISQANWEKMVEAGTKKKNPRNAAAGIINAKDIPEDIQYLDFIPYKVIYDPNHMFKSQLMDDMGDCPLCSWFPYFPGLPKCYMATYTEQDLIDMYNGWRAMWPCDGVVITSNNLNIQDDGIVNFDEVAYKFDSLKKNTTVESISWQLSRQSLLIPVANLTPVSIGGSTISRVTLHNAQTVVQLGIAPGSEVEILKSGDVIPYLNDVISNPVHEETSEIVKECPHCHQPVKWSGVHIICGNPQCGNRDFSDLKVWVQTLAEVEGIAEILLLKYLDRFRIESIKDLYTYDMKEFEGLKSEGVQSQKFFQVIQSLRFKPMDLEKCLVALNIPRLGEVTARKLATNADFQNLITIFRDNNYSYGGEEGIEAWYATIRNIVGVATAETVTDNIRKFYNFKYLDGRILYPVPASAHPEKELTFVCITGKLNSMSRKDFESMLLDKGYKVKEEVSKKVSYLITNTPDSSTSKNKRADELGIPKMTEADFLNMIN